MDHTSALAAIIRSRMLPLAPAEGAALAALRADLRSLAVLSDRLEAGLARVAATAATMTGSPTLHYPAAEAIASLVAGEPVALKEDALVACQLGACRSETEAPTGGKLRDLAGLDAAAALAADLLAGVFGDDVSSKASGLVQGGAR